MNRTWLFPYLTNQPVPLGSPKVRADHPYRKREGFHEFKETNDITDELTSYITFNVIRIFGK